MLEIEGLKRLQAKLGLGAVHVVELGEDRFVIELLSAALVAAGVDPRAVVAP